MTIAIFGISIFLGLLSILNKILLFMEKTSGWTTGMVIGVISGLYFYYIGLRILAVAEIGFFLVMLYGFVLHMKLPRDKLLIFNFILSVISLFLCYQLFVGSITTVETVSSLSFIWGGYQLTTNRKIFGWALLIIAHVTTSMASFHVGQIVFSGLQIVSAAVSVYAMVFLVFRKRNSTPYVHEG
jgi:hypothetical protein